MGGRIVFSSVLSGSIMAEKGSGEERGERGGRKRNRLELFPFMSQAL